MGVVAGILAAGCYSPAPPTGAPCPDGVCPRPLVCSPATQTCETTAAPADAAIDADPTMKIDAATDGPASPYAHRRRVTVTNTSGATMPAGYTIRVRFDLGSLVAAGKARADLPDVRVIGDGAIGERDRIIDAPGGQAPVAINFSLASPLGPGQTTNAFALYYGRANPGTPPQNGDAVFEIYDDFSTAIGTEWMKNGAPLVSNGKLVLRANHTDAITTTAATDGVPLTSAFELVANVVNPDSDPTAPNSNGTFYYWFGYQHTGDFNESDPWVVWIARGKSSIGAEQKSPVGCEAGCGGPVVGQNTLAHYYQIERDPTVTRFYKDGSLGYTATVTNSTDYSLMVRNFLATSELQVDFVRARVRVSPDPTVSLGAEEAL